MVRGLALDHPSFYIAVYHKVEGYFVGDQFLGAFDVDDVRRKVLKLFQARLYVNTKLNRVSWPYHYYSKPIEVFKVPLHQIYTAKAAEDIVYGQQSRHIKLELRIKL